MDQLLSVVIPVFNEAQTITAVLDALLAAPLDIPYEVIVVDDGSSDGTVSIVEGYIATHSQISLVKHEYNQGKTAALKTGFAATTGDIVIIQDADLEYDPTEIPAVIEPLVNEKAEVVYGSRFLVRKASRVLYFRHFIANRLITFLSDLLTDMNMTDVETCYKAMRGEIIRNMIITSSGFGFEIEVTAKIAKLKLRIYEVPISYYGRTYEEGKKIGFKDGLYALYYIFKYNLCCNLRDSYRSIPQIGRVKKSGSE